MRMILAWLGGGVIALISIPALAAPEAVRGVGFDETLSEEPVLARVLSENSATTPRPLAVRLIVDRAEVEVEPGSYDFSALDARIAIYRSLDEIRTLLDLRDSGPGTVTPEPWERFVRALAARYRGSVAGFVFGTQPGAATPPAPEYAFHVKSTAVNLRAGDDGALVILGRIERVDASWLASLYEEGIAAYVDAIGISAGGSIAGVLDVIEQHHPGAGIILLGEPLGDDPSTGPHRLLRSQLDVLGTVISAVTYRAPPAVVSAVLPAIEALGPLIDQQVVSLDDEPSGVRLLRAGREVTSTIPHRLLFGLSDSTRYFIYLAEEGPLELELSEPTGMRPVIHDPLSGARRPVSRFAYDESDRTATIGLPAEAWPLVVDWSTGESTGYSAGEDVSSTVLPSVAEILARHQQARTAQDALLGTWVASASMDLHFRPTAAETRFDIETENRFFVEGEQTEWEELSFRLNGTSWGPNRPPFPLLQAEKVLSLPLDLRLDADYRYRFEGIETLNGRECWVLQFDPIDEERSLFRGTVWIDRRSWMKAKVQSVQTGLSPPIVSTEEVQYFSPVGELDGRPVHLLTRLVARQLILVAGRTILVEREVRFDDFELNPADFHGRREAARASDRIMFRDTEQGLRYLVKQEGRRVVQDQATLSAMAALVGITYDPSYDYPLPLGGINYLDFDFLGTENQLALVFGGVLALVNVQRPRLLGDRVDGSFDLFVIAVEGSDRTYDSGGERTGQRLLTRPFSTAVNLGLRVAEFHRIGASYQFRYDHYSADETTSPEFEPPVSTGTHAIGLSWEWRRSGYSFVAGGTSHRRAEWRPWGDPGDFQAGDGEYLKYSASLTRDFHAGFHKFHVNAAYFGGRNLDRFSMYRFGLFDETKVRGVPSSGVRFGELGMLRGSYSFDLFEQYRLDLFLDQAFGRDRRAASNWQGITGVGAGFNMRGPWNTLLRGEVGKSFLPPEYREPGSIVVQFQILKPL